VPEEYGGPGLDYLSGCLIEEEFGWGCSGIGTSLACNGLASAPVALGGSEETKKKYLGMLCEEPKLASFCLTEPDAGSDVVGMKTRAVKKGDKYILNGSKCFITNGQSLALTPRWSPDYKSIAYVSYVGKTVRIYIYDVDQGRQRAIFETNNAVFAPRWSPDGRTLLFSQASGGNTDIFKIPATGGTPVRLTNTPGINVGGSFSPDGTKIVFESDRSGGQQIYVMNADGTDQRRISFGGGRYATPEWSPRGDLIAFTKMAGNFRIGVMSPSGGGERLLTNGWQDEAPTWSPNGRVLQFFRTSEGRSGKSSIWQVDLTGVNERHISTPVDGSDPSWGPLLQ